MAKKNTEKRNLILMRLLLVGLVVGAFFLGRYSSRAVPNDANTSIKSSELSTYTNTAYNFSLQYPKYLKDSVTDSEDAFSVDYSDGPSQYPLFLLHIIKTPLDPTTWWNKEGKNSYSWLFNTAINDVGVGDQYSIQAKEIVGQRKTMGGATLSTSLFIIPRDGYLLVINDNMKESYPETKSILSTLKFTK